MSRTGRKPIPIPEKVKASLHEREIHIEGPQGKLSLRLPLDISVEINEKQVLVKRANEERHAKSNHGLTRSLIANMVKGVTEGFKRELEISGVGYRAEVKGNDIHFSLGFSHPVIFPIPSGVKATVEKQTRLQLLGADRQLVGELAAEIRKVRPPEPYKGKGIKYADEIIRRKAGKAAAGTGATKGK